MTIAVTGATGFVGQALLDRAAAAGVPVRALTRREQPPRAGVEWVRGDLGDGAALTEMARGCTAVLHIAGVVNAPDEAGFEAGNVAGTAAVIAAARAAGAGRLIAVSSLSAREPELSAYGASKARAEALVRASGLDWTMLRPPAIYGPRDGEMFEMFRAARWGVVPMPPRIGRASYIHVDDLARLLLALVPGSELVTGRNFEPDDGHVGGWSHGEIARMLGTAMGRRAVPLHLPGIALRLAGRLDRLLRGDKAKLTPDRASYLLHPDWAVSEGARVPPVLWQPEIATPEGLAATAEWYRAAGWL